MALAIANDSKYEADLDYVDDNVEKLARRKVKSVEAKKTFAIQGEWERCVSCEASPRLRH